MRPERCETGWKLKTVNLEMMLSWVYSVPGVWATGCMLNWVYTVLGVNSWLWHGELEMDDLISWHQIMVEVRAGKTETRRDRGNHYEKLRQREFCVLVNWPSLICQVWLQIQQVSRLIWGILNPITQVGPLVSQIPSCPPYQFHLHSSYLFFVHSCAIIAEYNIKWSLDICTCHDHQITLCTAYMEFGIYNVQHTPNTVHNKYSIHQVQCTPSIVYTKYSTHQVQHIPSTAYTKYSIHQVQHTPSTAYTKYGIHQVKHTPSTAYKDYSKHHAKCALSRAYTTWSIYQGKRTLSTAYSKYSIPQGQHIPSTAYTEYSKHWVQHTPSTAFPEYCIHWVQHTPSSAYTEYTTHWVLYPPNIECLSFILTIVS